MKQSILTNAKELLKVNKNTLKGLHDTFKFNFDENSSVEIKEIKTPFTFNRIVKENDLTNKFAVILFNAPTGWRKDKWCVAILKQDGNFDIDTFKTSWESGIYDFFRKSDVNVIRRDKEVKAFLIYANKNDVMEVSNESWNKIYYHDDVLVKNLINEVKNDYRCLNRIKYNKKDIRTIVRSDKSVLIREIDFCTIDNGNTKITIGVDYYNRTSSMNINDVIDKSGYNVLVKRDYLKQKARELKAKRDLNKVQNKDFSQVNEKIRVEIFNTKKVLIDKLQNASFDTGYKLTCESEFKTILDKLASLNNLYSSYLQHLERLQEMYNNNNDAYRYKQYGSIADVEKAIGEMQNKLNELNK